MTLKIFALKACFLNTRTLCNFGNQTRIHQLVVPVTLQIPYGIQQKPYSQHEVRVKVGIAILRRLLLILRAFLKTTFRYLPGLFMKHRHFYKILGIISIQKSRFRISFSPISKLLEV